MAAIPVPGPAPWTIEWDDSPGNRRVIEALLCTSSGGLAARATSETDVDDRPADTVRFSGIYGPEPPGQLLAGPDWVPRAAAGTGRRWRLDLERGVVEHDIALEGGAALTTLRFSSAARPGTCVLWADPCPPATFEPLGARGPVTLVGMTGAASVSVREDRTPTTLLRVAAAARDDSVGAAADWARTRAEHALAAGGPALLEEHATAWSRRWADAEISIDGAPEDEIAVRFALYHLLSIPDGDAELAVGARSLTGPAYGGHVFWDADVYALPALCALAPEAARAMLEYRANRLGAARRRAAAEGRPGARFPWESAATGAEVTPEWATRIDGERVEVLTGEQELHINSDVAWAVLHHARWTGDDGFLAGPGTDLVLETARYLASRIEVGADGRGHLTKVMGPDEYHDAVDDNAFTNVMARWHLRQAAAMSPDPGETARMRRLADLLVDGYLPDAGRHEQFAGFDRLEPVLIGSVAQPPIAADILLGAAAVARSQVVKQADVVMLHHLIPDELPPGSMSADLDHYMPRTSHGSSLSPAVYASVLARAGRPDEALDLLRVALRIDLDDLTGTTAAGIHIAAMAGVWQALAHGFLGLRVDAGGTLLFDPRLPGQWDRLSLRCRVRGRRVEVTAEHGSAVLESDGPLPVRWPGGEDARGLDRIRLVGGPSRWRRLS